MSTTWTIQMYVPSISNIPSVFAEDFPHPGIPVLWAMWVAQIASESETFEDEELPELIDDDSHIMDDSELSCNSTIHDDSHVIENDQD